MINEESEVKFVVSSDDMAAFVQLGAVESRGSKDVQYFDDPAGKLAEARATYRRYKSKGVMVDELKTLSSWDSAGRVCEETCAPVSERTLGFDALELSDIDSCVAEAVRRVAGDCVLVRAEKLKIDRTKLRVPGFARVFDVDACDGEAGVRFCEIEFESPDAEERLRAKRLITERCVSATPSVVSKRERARVRT